MRSWDSSVSEVTCYGLDDQGLISNRDRDFSPCHHVKTGFGIHPAVYPMGMYWVLFSRGKAVKA
jgi:hypothetical protein